MHCTFRERQCAASMKKNMMDAAHQGWRGQNDSPLTFEPGHAGVIRHHVSSPLLSMMALSASRAGGSAVADTGQNESNGAAMEACGTRRREA